VEGDSRPPLKVQLATWLRQPVHLGLVAIWLFLLAAAVTVPVDRKGDGSEYILATESLLYDRDLTIDNKVDIFRHLMQRPQRMDSPAGLTRIVCPDGRERYGLHSFYYPLLALPFYALFGYQGFYLLNALFVGVMVTGVYLHVARTHPQPLALAFSALSIFLSATWSYVFWTQAEPVYAGLLTLFLWAWFKERPLVAAAFGGLPFAAQPALGLFAVPMLIELGLRKRYKEAAFAAAIFAVWAAPQYAYNAFVLGSLVPMTAQGLAATSYASAGLVVRLLFDPSMGLFWFYPAALYCLVCLRPSFRSISLLVAALGVLAMMTVVYDFYSHQVGSRYANWVFPALLLATGPLRTDGWAPRISALFAIVAGAGLAINPLGNSRDMDVRGKTLLAYHVFGRIKGAWENPEVFRFGSEVLTVDRVYTRRVTKDGWTWGDDRADLMLLGVRPGALMLELQSWPHQEDRQIVKLVTAGGTLREVSFDPAKVERVEIPLEDPDIRGYKRWKDRTYAYLSISADGWSPAIEQQGDRPEAHDLRRLGVRIERITLNGETLFERVAPKP
jgi:hypothetical protein